MKKYIGKIVKFVYFFSAMFVVMSSQAHAYIDPSATTYVIQAVGAAVIALGAVITVFRHKIASFFKKGSAGEQKKEIHFVDDDSSSDNQ